MWTIPFVFDVQKSMLEGTYERQRQTMVPAVDVYENSREFTVVARMPGVAPEKLSVEVEGDSLRIEGEVDVGLAEGDAVVFEESQTTRYARSFRLGRDLDASHIEAQLKNGLLKVKVPKLEVARSRKVEVAVN
jgi:HSP20 family molecular chaperone IbpA